MCLNDLLLPLLFFNFFGTFYYRKDGQDTQEELERRDLKQELEERERRHFSSKDKGYNGNFTSNCF